MTEEPSASISLGWQGTVKVARERSYVKFVNSNNCNYYKARCKKCDDQSTCFKCMFVFSNSVPFWLAQRLFILFRV